MPAATVPIRNRADQESRSAGIATFPRMSVMYASFVQTSRADLVAASSQ